MAMLSGAAVVFRSQLWDNTYMSEGQYNMVEQSNNTLD